MRLIDERFYGHNPQEFFQISTKNIHRVNKVYLRFRHKDVYTSFFAQADTGSEVNVITSSYLRYLQLDKKTREPSSIILDTFGDKKIPTHNSVTLKLLLSNSETEIPIKFLIQEENHISNATLGQNFLRRYNIDLNFASTVNNIYQATSLTHKGPYYGLKTTMYSNSYSLLDINKETKLIPENDKVNYGPPKVNILTNGTELEYFLDTGATYSVMEERAIEEQNWLHLIQPTTVKMLNGASSTDTVRVLGQITLQLSLKSSESTESKEIRHTFLVTNGSGEMQSLGLTLFTENELIHSSSTNRIMTSNETAYNSYYYPRDINVEKPQPHRSNMTTLNTEYQKKEEKKQTEAYRNRDETIPLKYKKMNITPKPVKNETTMRQAEKTQMNHPTSQIIDTIHEEDQIMNHPTSQMKDTTYEEDQTMNHPNLHTKDIETQENQAMNHLSLSTNINKTPKQQKTTLEEEEKGEIDDAVIPIENNPLDDIDLYQEEEELPEETTHIKVYTNTTIFIPRNATNVAIPIGITHKHRKLFNKDVLIKDTYPTTATEEHITTYIPTQITKLRITTYVMFINPTNEVQEIPEGTYLGEWEINAKENEEIPQHTPSKRLQKLSRKINAKLKNKIKQLPNHEIEARNKIMTEKLDCIEETQINPDITPRQKLYLLETLWRYNKAFSKNQYDVGKIPNRSFNIYLTTDEILNTKQYQTPLTEADEIRATIDKYLKMGVIERSQSEYNSPIIMIKKKDGSLRMVTDFRNINKHTVKDFHPLQPTSYYINKIKNYKYYTSLDITMAYSHLMLPEEMRPITAFTALGQKLHWKTAAFGLKNAGFAWSRVIEEILQDTDQRYTSHYVDDILCHTETIDSNIEAIGEVLEQMVNNNVKLKASKCHFLQTKINFLGYTITEDGVQSNTEKVAAIFEMAQPTNKKEAQSLQGFTNFFREFIPGLQPILAPIIDLTSRYNKFEWKSIHERAFAILSKRMATSPVLINFDTQKPIEIFTDASSRGAAAVLTQRDSKKRKHPVAYWSHKWNKADTIKKIFFLEFIAMMRAIIHWHNFLKGNEDITIYTDCSCLKATMYTKKPPVYFQRYLLDLTKYNMTICHIPGKHNTIADHLSRAFTIDGPLFPPATKSILNFPKIKVSEEAIETWKQELMNSLTSIDTRRHEESRIQPNIDTENKRNIGLENTDNINNSISLYEEISKALIGSTDIAILLKTLALRYYEKNTELFEEERTETQRTVNWQIKRKIQSLDEEADWLSSLLYIPIIISKHNGHHTAFPRSMNTKRPIPPLGVIIELERKEDNTFIWKNQSLTREIEELNSSTEPEELIEMDNKYKITSEEIKVLQKKIMALPDSTEEDGIEEFEFDERTEKALHKILRYQPHRESKITEIDRLNYPIPIPVKRKRKPEPTTRKKQKSGEEDKEPWIQPNPNTPLNSETTTPKPTQTEIHPKDNPNLEFIEETSNDDKQLRTKPNLDEPQNFDKATPKPAPRTLYPRDTPTTKLIEETSNDDKETGTKHNPDEHPNPNQNTQENHPKPRFHEEIEVLTDKSGKQLFDVAKAIEDSDEDFPITLIPQTKQKRPQIANRPRQGTVKEITKYYPPLTMEKLIEYQNNDELCQTLLDIIQDKPLRHHITAISRKRLEIIKPYMTIKNGIIVKKDINQETQETEYKPLAPILLVQQLCYDLHYSNFHPGITRTIKLVESKFYRPRIFGSPSLQTMLKPYVEECAKCIQKTSVHVSKPFPILLNPIATKPRTIYMFDFWGPCGESIETETVNNIRRYTGRIFKYILVAKDMFSSLIWLYPTQKQSGNEVVNLLTNIIAEQGVPTAIRSDNHSVFRSKILEHTCQELGIKQHFPLPYRPESQGSIEREMIQISDALKTEDEKDGWHKIIPFLQLVLNNLYNKTLDNSPYHIHYGVDAILPHQVIYPNGEELPKPKEYARKLQENLSKIHGRILPRIIKSRIKDHNYYNNKRKEHREINVGDVVEIKLPLPKSTPSKNHSPWTGFYRVIEIKGRAVTVRTKGGKGIYRTHINRVARVANQFDKKILHWLRAQQIHTSEMEKMEVKQEEDEYIRQTPEEVRHQQMTETPHQNQLAICDITDRKPNQTSIMKQTLYIKPKLTIYRNTDYLW